MAAQSIQGGRLSASGLVLSRAGRVVLRGAGLEVEAGRVTALLAPSGSGKSTLLRCCNGLLWPSAGTVRLDGTDIRRIEPTELRRRVGLVAQWPRMLPGTVADNVSHGVEEADVAVELEAAGLDPELADRPAGELSGGEQARVAVARALSREPSVLLLDEPTAALDREASTLLARTVRELAERGLGICAATHDLVWAREIADRRVELDPPLR